MQLLQSRTFYFACMLLVSLATISASAGRPQAAAARTVESPRAASPIVGLGARPSPRILLVDDDTNDPDVRSYFTDALDGLNASYDTWDTATHDEPTSAVLANYATVIWFTGLGGFPNDTAEVALADFLDHGHCLFMSSQEYLYNLGSAPTAFMQTYLGVASADDDVSAISVTGVGPVFGGIGPSVLDLPYENRTDRISPAASASVAFSGLNPGLVDSGVQKDTGSYRTTYWGFGFEGLPSAAERQSAMQRVLSWCDFQADLSIQLTASPAVVLRPGQPLTYTLSFKNDGVAIASDVLLTDTLPAALSNLSITSSGPAISKLPGAPYRWHVADIAPGASGTITITGVVDRKLAADIGSANIASLTSDTYDSDPTNNSAQTAFDVMLPRLAFDSASYSVAEHSSTALITVTLDAPNQFADTHVTYATSDGSAHAGSDYTAQTGTLTIPAGQTSATFGVPIIDDTAPESGETVLLSLSNASGALSATPSSATLTILSNDGVLSPQITSPIPLSARDGVAYSHQFTATGLPQPSFTLTSGGLPPGLTLSADGVLSGLPTQAGSYSGIGVTASNGMAPDAIQTFSIVVAGAGADVYLPLMIR